MTYTTTARKEELEKIFLPKSLNGSRFKITITPISEEEVEDIEFQSLKGITGREMTLDDVRRERLGL